MRSTRWPAALAAVAIAVLAGCAGGEGTLRESAENTPTTAQETEAAPVSKEATTTSSEPAEETTQASPATAEAGTRANPGLPGRDTATFSSSDEVVEISLGEANWDANAIVAAENQFNDPPEEGMVYVLVPVTATYTGPEKMTPWIDISVIFLADDGRSYESGYEVIPDDLSDVADIYDGGTATGNVLFALPIDQVPGGMWGVSYNWSDPLWWEAV